mmetsp:Transcript_30696/g.71919  ORF Transcript_30696/g.71919 Transcript_30696/m.71919 type:complete len:410 (-) Transcript_30696:32-1261(-)
MLGLRFIPFIALQLSALFASQAYAATNIQKATSGGEDKMKFHADSLVAWLMESKGGRESKGVWNPSIEMRRADPFDPTSRFGMFANADIGKDTVLIHIPQSMLLDSREENPEGMECGTVHNLIEQFELKDESKYAPYVNYLLDTQPPGQLPSAWSEAGKRLFNLALVGGDDKDGEYVALPPDAPTTWVNTFWHGTCKGGKDPLHEHASLLVVQRNWDDLLIPLFDMMNHRNGHWYNTISNEVHGGEPVVIKARRDIKAGEELYNSYNMCSDCYGRMTDYGTPEILRDYGFVEEYPHTWIFDDADVAFRVDEVYDAEGNGTGEYEVTEWIEWVPLGEDMKEIQVIYLKQIRDTKNKLFLERDPEVPEHEWLTAKNYLDAMEFDIKIAIRDFDELEDAEKMNDGQFVFDEF